MWKRPAQFDTYKNQLRKIIAENPDYWLNSENSWALHLEWVDRHRIKLGTLKSQLQHTLIPSMDTLIRRVREIKEEMRNRQHERLNLADPKEFSKQVLS